MCKKEKTTFNQYGPNSQQVNKQYNYYKISPFLRKIIKDFWFVRVKTFKILILSFLICFAATIYNGILFIDSDNGFNSFIFGIFGILITLLYFFFFKMFEKEEIKKHNKIRNDYRKLWLKLDLLFTVAIFWLLF